MSSKKIKVFLVQTAFSSHLYTCRGVAVDHMKGSSVWEPTLSECWLCYNNDEELKTLEGATAYRCMDDNKATDWFFTEVEAQTAGKSMGIEVLSSLECCSEEMATISTESIFPLPEKVPVIFSRNHEGRLYTRINSHPEVDGTKTKGKIFFPDRAFSFADVGNAVVSISKEFDTYGFLTGEMERFDRNSPTMEEVLDWAWEEERDKQELVIIDSPARGRYFAVTTDGVTFRQIVYADPDEKARGLLASWAYTDIVKEDAARYTEQRATFAALFVRDAWGSDVDVDAVFSAFHQSEFYEKTGEGRPWERSIKFHGELMDRAVRCGLVSLHLLQKHHIEAVEFHSDVFAALSFSLDELRQLAEEVSAINTEADRAANNLRRKGRLMW